MKQVKSIVEPSPSKVYFDMVDSIINAQKIEQMCELKKLINGIDQLIQSIISQILSGNLTEKGAKIKILRLIELINHSQIGNHMKIKTHLQTLKQTFKNRFKVSFEDINISIKTKPIILTNQQISHYVDCIKDTQLNPIYSETPKKINDTIIKKKTPKDFPTKSFIQHYLLQLKSTTENNNNTKKRTSEITPIHNKERNIYFQKIQNQLKEHGVYTTT